MISLDKHSLDTALNQQLSLQLASLEGVWEACEWSQTFKLVDRSGLSYFLKGTPRTRKEAQLTAILHAYEPNHIPKVIHSDLLPEHEWCWFLMADAGSTDYEQLSFQTALNTAFAIGSLQRKVLQDPQLPELLPQCLPEQFPKILQESLDWLENTFANPPSDLIARTRSMVVLNRAFFEEIRSKLAGLKPSCVHLDLWSGNLAVSKNELVILDWGDAIWGIGTVSIVQMLLASETKFDEAQIWKAYSEGLQSEISPEIIQTSHIAWVLTSLLLERQLAAYSSDIGSLPLGIPPLLEELLRLVT